MSSTGNLWCDFQNKAMHALHYFWMRAAIYPNDAPLITKLYFPYKVDFSPYAFYEMNFQHADEHHVKAVKVSSAFVIAPKALQMENVLGDVTNCYEGQVFSRFLKNIPSRRHEMQSVIITVVAEIDMLVLLLLEQINYG